MTATVGAKPPQPPRHSTSLLDFRVDVTLDGEPLTQAEIRKLLEGSDGLALLRGRWVEVDRERLNGLIDQFGQVERAAAEGGLTFAEAMRLVSGLDAGQGSPPSDEDRRLVGRDCRALARERAAGAARPRGARRVSIPGPTLHGTLRPYQQVGVRWLYLLSRSGSAPASPTTWGSARRSRCLRSCSC